MVRCLWLAFLNVLVSFFIGSALRVDSFRLPHNAATQRKRTNDYLSPRIISQLKVRPALPILHSQLDYNSNDFLGDCNDDGDLLGWDDSEILDDDDDDNNAVMEEKLLDYAIDSFLRGDYDRPFADDAPAPHPGLTPRTTVESALASLRQLDDPEPSHGAAVLLRFCVPLSRGERWGDSNPSSSSRASSSWKELLRGALNPSMLANRLRASEFSCLLDWENLDVTEGAYSIQGDEDDNIIMGVPSSVAFVNAALYFGDGQEPILVQFTLRKVNGVWLIDSARLNAKGLFVD